MSSESLIWRTSVRSRALLVLIGAMFVLWTLWSTAVLPYLPPLQGWVSTLQSIGVRLLLWVCPCFIYLWCNKGAGWARGLGLGLPATWERAVAVLVLVAAAALAVSVDVAQKLGSNVPGVWLHLFTSGRFEGFQTPFFEELIFRGVIFSELLNLSGLSHTAEPMAFTVRVKRAWLANLGASIVFVGMHWPWWIFIDGLGLELVRKSVPVLLLSLVLGVVFARGRSIWPCVLLHWLNNSLAQLAGN